MLCKLFEARVVLFFFLALGSNVLNNRYFGRVLRYFRYIWYFVNCLDRLNILLFVKINYFWIWILNFFILGFRLKFLYFRKIIFGKFFFTSLKLYFFYRTYILGSVCIFSSFLSHDSTISVFSSFVYFRSWNNFNILSSSNTRVF